MVSTMRYVIVKGEFFHGLEGALSQFLSTRPGWGSERSHSPRLGTKRRFQSRMAARIQQKWKGFVRRKAFQLELQAYQRVKTFVGVAKFVSAAISIQKHVRGRRCRRQLGRRTRLPIAKRNVYGKDKWHVLVDASQARCARFRQRRINYVAALERLVALVATRQAKLAQFRELQHLLATTPPDQTIATSLIDGFPSKYAAPIVDKFLARSLPKLEAKVLGCENEWTTTRTNDPILHDASTMISSKYRVVRCKRKYENERAACRARQLQLVHSSAACMVRMNFAMKQRALNRIIDAATRISSWWKMTQAKSVLKALRKAHAHLLLQVFRRLFLTMRSRAPIARRACFCSMIVRQYHKLVARRLSTRVFQAWRGYTIQELDLARQRREIEQAGMRRIIHSSACQIQHLVHRFVHDTRPKYAKEVMDVMHPVVASYVAKCSESGDLAQLIHAIHNDVNSWPSVDSIWTTLADRYHYPLALPEPVQVWWPSTLAILQLGKNEQTKVVPWRIKDLAFLDSISSRYAAMDLLGMHLVAIEARHEVVCVVRSYLVHLMTTHKLLKPGKLRPRMATEKQWSIAATTMALRTWSSRLKQDYEIRSQLHASPGTTTAETNQFYMQFHSDSGSYPSLCSNCYAMLEPELYPSQCTCGFDYIRRPTMAITTSPQGNFHDSRGKNNNGKASILTNRQEFQGEASDLLLVHAFFHAMAPLGHQNRLLPPPQLWRIAMAQALPFIEVMHANKLHSLDALYQEPASLMGNAMQLPARVYARLVEFVDELVCQHKQLQDTR
ncbi:hypothetical protein AeRB84_003676 [Aphanomyces euteiches]|nr:hypothetical protein AeRB84_003676 [Aphanomyces euteiches]